jgi:uncharacterized membrane protein YbhN (UPF0104 family)
MNHILSRRNLYQHLVGITILITFGLVIAFYLSANSELVLLLTQVSPLWLLSLVAFRIVFLATSGLFLREFAAKFGIHLNFREWFGLAIVTAMGNYLTPFSGGLIARATYLKQRHRFPYTQFATLLSANYLVAFWVVALIGAAASVGYRQKTESSWILALFFMTVALVIPALLILPWPDLLGRNRFGDAARRSLQGWIAIRQDKLFLSKLIFYTLINVAFNGFSFWIAYLALNEDVSLVAALLVSLMAVFSLLVNITPAGLGIQEAVITLSSSLVGVGAGVGLLVALLIRAATLLPVFCLGPFFSYVLAQELLAKQAE